MTKVSEEGDSSGGAAPPEDDGGNLAPVDFKVATLNVNHAFSAHAEAIFELARSEQAHALCIQEAGLDPSERQRARIREAAARHGFKFTYFGHPHHCPQKGTTISVIIFTTLFSRAGALPERERHAEFWAGRAVIAHIPRQGTHPLTLACLYAHATEPHERNAIIKSITAGLADRNPKRDFIVIGDLNCTRSEGAVASLLANNVCKCANDLFDPIEPVTRLPGTRCIDYALHSHTLAASKRTMLIGYRDHFYVQYDFPAKFSWPKYGRPVRPRLTAQEASSEVFHALWDDDAFERSLLEDDVSAGWKMLSTTAEVLLRDDDDEGGIPRDRQWTPTQEGMGPTSESMPVTDGQLTRATFRYARLHRILRLTLEVALRLDRGIDDHDLRGALCRKIKSIRHLHPKLLRHPVGTQDSINAITECLEAEARRARSRALDCFQVRVEGEGGFTKENMAAQRRWVKSRIQEEHQAQAPTKRQVHEVKHPFDQAVHTAGLWTEIWNAPHPADGGTRDDLQEELDAKEDFIKEFLGWIPEGGYDFPTLRFEAHKLWAIAKEGATKAPGGDDWRPVDLVKLPLPWWEKFARLWERITQVGACPAVWADIVVALLDKDDGSQRPLSIASALWRIGATCIVRQLAPWINQWAPFELSGGLPDRTAAYVHARLAQAFEDKSKREQIGAVFEDLSKAFDNVDVGQCLAIWRKLGAPTSLLAMIRDFYQKAKRLFTCKGWASPAWTKALHSLLQGCPFSTILIGALMACWVKHVKGKVPGVQIGVFVDDRSMWAAGSKQHETLRDALLASKPFDEKFKCQLNVAKTQLLGNTPLARKNLATIGLGDKAPTNEGKLLGLIYQFQESALKVSIDPKAITRCRERLKLIQYVASALQVRRIHVRTLALSQVLWAGAIAQPTSEQLKSLRTPVQTALLRWDRPKGASQYLTWNVRLGPMDDPVFLARRATLAMVIWFDRRRDVPGWHHDMGLRALEASPFHWNPEVKKMVLAMKWGFSPQERCLSKTLPDGRTTFFRFGIDGDVVLRNWLVLEWRKELFAADGRTWTAKAPVDDGLAQGLRLPRPPRDTLPVTMAMGRRIANYWHQDKLSWQIRVATGGDHAFIKKKFNLKASPECACGRRNPSTYHVVWNCSEIGLRATTKTINEVGMKPDRPPTNTAEERLFAPVIEQPPLPHKCEDGMPDLYEELVAEVKGYLGSEWAESTRALIGTDGGSKFGLASWAVALGCDTVGDAITGEDYVATAAEIMALFQLLGAVARTVKGDEPITLEGGLVGKCLDIACDCKPAISFVENKTPPSQRYRMHRAIRNFVSDIKEAGVRLRFIWVPSHDKESKNFTIPPEYCEQQLRIVNRRADDEATKQLKGMLEETPIVAWRKKYKKCAEWSSDAIRWATARCRFFHNHVATREGIVDPVAVELTDGQPLPFDTEEHMKWTREMEEWLGPTLNATDPIDFTHASPVPTQVDGLASEAQTDPLPAREGIALPERSASLSAEPAPVRATAVDEQTSARNKDFDPFSEDGDHDWLLHQEEDALFSQGPDADFFGVGELIF